MGHFASSTSVRRIEPVSQSTPPPQDSTRYHAEIADGWDIVGNANGGYLMAIAARAALEESGRPDVVSMAANFLSPGKPGPVEISVEPIRSGRRFSTSRSTIRGAEDQRIAIATTVICGDLAASDGPTRVAIVPPDLPPLDECERVMPTEVFPPPFVGNLEMRIHPDDVAGFTGGDPHGEPLFRAWFRLLDDEPMDSLAVVLAGDALPPPIFNTDLPTGWAPTVQLTIHVHARPQTPWVMIDQRADIIDGGSFETVTSIFDQNGGVIGRARQLQLLALS